MAELLEPKVALVTGASSGIGRATARAFAEAGFCTIIADVDEEAGREAAAEIGCGCAECIFMRCDVANEEDVRGSGIELAGGALEGASL